MRNTIGSAAFCLALFAPLAAAYEYPLQFTPNPGYRNLVVAGYAFDKDGTEIVGNCSYTVTGGGGKGGRTVAKAYAQTCRWDSTGNLLSVAPGAPAIPEPLYTNGSRVVFAVNGNGNTTGVDLALPGRGFVSTPGSHYTWLTPQDNVALQPLVYTITATLKSDGDLPLEITAVEAIALKGTATIQSTTCVGSIKVGATCSINATFDATQIHSTRGLSFDTFQIDLTSDAGDALAFIVNFRNIAPRRD